MRSDIARVFTPPTTTVTFTNSDNTTGGFSLAVFSGALIHVTGGTAGTVLTWKVKESAGASTAYALANSTDSTITTVVQPNRAYAVPDEAFASGYVMATTNSGTVTCRVSLKG